MHQHLVINFVVGVREVDGRFARSGETRHEFGCFVVLIKFCKNISIYEKIHKLKYFYLFIWLSSKTNPIMVLYHFLTIVGIVLGHMFRYEHAKIPFNKPLRVIWCIGSLYGLIFTQFTSMSYLMTMIIIGWMNCEYTQDYKYQTLYF
tara:strand:+ start:200 stop:640 length:441 start_codon:yes stop_codon:yes gene_type:complete